MVQDRVYWYNTGYISKYKTGRDRVCEYKTRVNDINSIVHNI